jgi:nucleoside phosphorylase
MQSRPIRTVAVIMAMRAEARPLIELVGAAERELPETVGPLPIQWYDARVGGLNVVISVNGTDRRRGVDEIGTQPAVLNAYVTMVHRRPDLVISAGTAGGWGRHGTRVGDVFVSRDRFVFHDRRIPLPGFDQYGIGSYASVDASHLARALHLKQGIVSTGNSLDEALDDGRAIIASGATVKDMEAAAGGRDARRADARPQIDHRSDRRADRDGRAVRRQPRPGVAATARHLGGGARVLRGPHHW